MTTVAKFRHRLEALGISERRFSLALGVHPVTMSRWVAADYRDDALTIPRYALSFLEALEELPATRREALMQRLAPLKRGAAA